MLCDFQVEFRAARTLFSSFFVCKKHIYLHSHYDKWDFALPLRMRRGERANENEKFISNTPNTCSTLLLYNFGFHTFFFRPQPSPRCRPPKSTTTAGKREFSRNLIWTETMRETKGWKRIFHRLIFQTIILKRAGMMNSTSESLAVSREDAQRSRRSET